MATYNFIGVLQYVTVPQGTFTITAAGAQGGSGAGVAGGLGAIAAGDFTFQTATSLIILVGGAGSSANYYGAGGGGGSFIYIDVDNDNSITSNDTLLLAAGGGGGSNYDSNGQGANGYVPSFSLGGDAGSGPFAGGGGAGTGGAGGGTATSSTGGGASSIETAGIGSGNGGIGGNGGFGGGGGGGIDGGGGGGGYGGGQGGYTGFQGPIPGIGGTSYSASGATNTSSSAATNQGNGVVSVTCYAAGTRIRTVAGEVAVEALRVGDLVVTASGEPRPIRWLGHRRLACHGRADVQPVRISAHAFGEGRPARDLTVSPAHALCVEVDGGEVLIPAVRLINGTTIARAEVDSVTYWHVELDSHDILVADGLPAESYLDCSNRSFFASTPVTSLRAMPDERPDGRLPFCRPFHEAGPLVEAIRAQLDEQARVLGWQLDAAPSMGLHLVADGRVIHPEIDGMSANFVLPAGADDVRLVSGTSVPAHVVSGSTDDRRLGVSIRSLVLDDGVTGARDVALNDLRLSLGFHPGESDDCGTHWRWTDGAAMLPAALWRGCHGEVRVQVALAGSALPRWVSPSTQADMITMSGLRHCA